MKNLSIFKKKLSALALLLTVCMVTSVISIDAKVSPHINKLDFKNSAVGFTDSKGNSAVPKITITDGHIKSVWSTQGCGNIKHTWLTGSGGNYYLSQGDANITPGTYSLQIDGNITQTSTGPCSGFGKVEITLYYN